MTQPDLEEVSGNAASTMGTAAEAVRDYAQHASDSVQHTATFREFLDALAGSSEVNGWRILTFRYPGNGSLAQAGELLTREIDRVFANPQQATFLCYSAGGLVFRYYAERRGGTSNGRYFWGRPTVAPL